MIPRIPSPTTTHTLYLSYLKALKAHGFAGEIHDDYDHRITLATDNSIYQWLPQAVVYPTSIEDLAKVAEVANQPAFHEIVLTPRGGGTGTNGQSLTDGIVVDISRHMNNILEINAEERWVRVQTGVVKDQLNAALKPYGLFFAPELSTSNRATLGGMINTDASGQGSCAYGKTRDHVLSLTSVLMDGTQLTSHSISDEALNQAKQSSGIAATAHQVVDDIFARCQYDITEKFPPLNRCLTGYDLAHIRDDQGLFNLNSVLCGSEGSLAFIAEAKLNVLPIPAFSALVNVKYDSFATSLRDATQLMAFAPTSIETVDSKVLNLAMEDIIWDTVADFFPADTNEPAIRGINLVEFTADSQDALEQKIAKLSQYLEGTTGETVASFGFTVARGDAEVKKIWAMRKKSVGLLGNAKGEERPIPFVEDVAVPPEHLADFIMAFRQVLDNKGLQYGMFGHVDAGVLHVRPAIDQNAPAQAPLVGEITDEVVALVQQYNGLLWGEHGKGVRSEYAPAFFGSLYPEIQRVKAAFDPRGQLNRGKVATPLAEESQAQPIELVKIDQVPTRGQFDRQISPDNWQTYQQALYCNGNGACYNYDPNDAMCPSWKGTRLRTHSPKGRASLIREWVRLMDNKGVTLNRDDSIHPLLNGPKRLLNTLKKHQGEYDFSHQVHESMMACLACKSCVGQCPIKVNVPAFRANFLEAYYGRYLRPVKDYLVGSLEYLIPIVTKAPRLYNALIGNQLSAKALEHLMGLVDSPKLTSQNLGRDLAQRGVNIATPKQLASLTPAQREKHVVLVQDAFTSHFETTLLLDVIDVLQALGFDVSLAPFKPNGKPLHVHGFLKAFNTAATVNAEQLNALAAYEVPLVGVDPSMTLTYRQEYAQHINNTPPVLLLQEWLATQQHRLEPLAPQGEFHLLAHCTEKTTEAGSINLWVTLFAALGQQLTVVPTGCCGMSGTYGHEKANLNTSKAIYESSWQPLVAQPNAENTLLATGYSCRSQVKRFENKQIKHPLQALKQLITQHTS